MIPINRLVVDRGTTGGGGGAIGGGPGGAEKLFRPPLGLGGVGGGGGIEPLKLGR